MSKRNKPDPPVPKKIQHTDSQVLPNQSIFKNTYLQILAIIICIGAILRFYNLSASSLWLDEASTYALSKLDLIKIWEIGFTGDNNPPLFHWITHFMLMFGSSEFVLRFLPAVMGVATIVTVYYIGKLYKDEVTGLIAATLVSVSPFCLNYAQEAYSYSMVMFVSSLVYVYYLKSIKTNTTHNWLLFGAFSALAFWTHFYTCILLLLLYVHAIIQFRVDIIDRTFSNIKSFILALGLTALLSSPIIYMAIYRFMTLTSNPVTYGVIGISMIPQTIYRFAGFNWYVAAIYMILMCIGLLYLYLKNKPMFVLSALFVTFPLIISIIISAKMTMNPRYLIYLLPIIFVTIACSYSILEKFITDKRLVYVVISALVIINALPISSYYSTAKSEDWRGYSERLYSMTADGDIVVTVPGYISSPLNYYYNHTDDHTTEIGATTSTDLESAMNLKENADQTVYFVVTSDINAANPQGDAINWLNTKTKRIGEYIGIYTFSA